MAAVLDPPADGTPAESLPAPDAKTPQPQTATDTIEPKEKIASTGTRTTETAPAPATIEAAKDAPATASKTTIDTAASPPQPSATTTKDEVATTTPATATATATSPTSTLGGSTAVTATPSLTDSTVNPPDFVGSVDTNDEVPSLETLRRIADYTVVNQAGKSVPFRSLYQGPNAARRVLVIFVRHFFCGLCQEYLRAVAASSVTPEALLRLPVSTFVCVVGCGDPGLIDHYVSETGCPFPVYADPTRRLYDELGMVRTLSPGDRPAYVRDQNFAHTVVTGIRQALKQARSGLMLKAGDQRQVGGEFLFEPVSMSLETPVGTPRAHDEDGQAAAAGNHDAEKNPLEQPLSHATTAGEDASSKPVEEKKITWCHRMRTTRDHVEIPELLEVLGLDGTGEVIKDEKRWEKALRTRKGTGLSMSSKMGRESTDIKA